MSKRSDIVALTLRRLVTRPVVIATVALGALLRLFVKVRYASPLEPNLWEFGVIAENLLNRGTFAFFSPTAPTAYMPPGYPILIYLVYTTLGVGPSAHAVLGGILLAASLALALLIGWIARRIWGDLTGFIALALALFWPHLVLMSGRYHSLPISTALLVGAIAIMMRDDLPAMRRAWLSGLLLGLHMTMRFEGALMLLPLGYLLLRTMDGPWSRRAVLGAILVATSILPIAPWVMRNAVVFNAPVLSTSAGFNLARGHNRATLGTGRNEAGNWAELPFDPPVALDEIDEPADEIARDRYFRDAVAEYALEHPAREIELALRKAYYFVVADFTHPVDKRWLVWIPTFLALAIGLVFWLKRQRGSPRKAALWMVYALQLATCIVVFVQPRYRMAVAFVPILFFAAWIGTVATPWLADGLRRRAE